MLFLLILLQTWGFLLANLLSSLSLTSMSDADRSSIASMAALSISSSSCVILDSPGNDQVPISTGPGTSRDKVGVSKLESDVPSATPSNRVMLTMVLLSTKDKEMEEKYAVMPVPDNVILRCSTKNRNEKWVWADILPENWKMALELNHTEVEIFERYKEAFSPERLFAHGEMFTTFGTRHDGLTTWTTVRKHYPVDRPETYSEAVETMRANHPLFPTRNQDKFQTSTRIRFYTFPQDNLRVWNVIPLEAHSNDDLWRSSVPEPGHVLGAIAE